MWLLILLLAIAAAIVTISVVNSSTFGPQQTVRNYLAALHAGDGAKALGLLQARVPGANAVALNGPALAKSQEALKDVTVGTPLNSTDGKKTVAVGYTVDGTELSTDFTLVKGPKHWLFFDSWTLAPTTLPILSVSVVNANQASVNGVAVNMPDGKNSFAVFYPGHYETEYRSQFFTAPPVTRTVTGPSAAIPAVVLATGPTSELLSQVDTTIHNYLDACAKQGVLMPAGCPMSAVTNNRVVSPITWTILEYPEVAISPYGGRWILAPMQFKAQLEYQEQSLFTGLTAPVKSVQQFGFTAKLAITDTTVTVTPQLSY